jgi:hypothetical protein
MNLLATTRMLCMTPPHYYRSFGQVITIVSRVCQSKSWATTKDKDVPHFSKDTVLMAPSKNGFLEVHFPPGP